MAQNNEFDILEFATSVSKVIEANFKQIVAVLVIAVLGGSGWVLMGKMETAKQHDAFSKLYAITKVYDQKKQDFAEAKADKEADVTDKDPKKDQTKDDKVLVEASGDLAKDYPNTPEALEKFVSENIGLNASGEAALTLSELYEEYEKNDEAIAIIEKALNGLSGENLIVEVLSMRAGDLLAMKGDCQKAVGYWQKIEKAGSFMSSASQLKAGACFLNKGQVDQAKVWLEKAQSKNPESPEAYSAKRYLRYLRFKKGFGNEKSSDQAS